MFRITRFELDNGLRVVVVELPHLHTATLAAFVKAGSRYESTDDNGLSHFVEHMLFRGTERYPTSYELAFAIERVGSSLQAETGRDDSLFQLDLEPDELEEGMAIFGEIFARPRFGDIELERELILEELTEDYDSRGQEINADDIARGLLFDGHPLAQRIIGPRTNVERFTRADVQRHFARLYGARNTVLCVAGPVDPDRVRSAATRHLETWPQGEESPVPAVPGPVGRPLFRHVRDRGSQVELSLIVRAVPEDDRDYASCVTLLRALDDGMSTRLHYRLCDQLGLAYSVSASLEPLQGVTLLDVVANAQPGKVGALIGETLGIFDELRGRPLPDAELDKIKRRYRYELSSAVDDSGDMAAWFGGTALHRPPMSFADTLTRMEQVTAETVQRMARRVLDPSNLAVAVVGDLSRAREAAIRSAIARWAPPG